MRSALAISLGLHVLVAAVLVVRKPHRPTVNEAIEVTVEASASPEASAVRVAARAGEALSHAPTRQIPSRDRERLNDRVGPSSREGSGAPLAAEQRGNGETGAVAEERPRAASGWETFGPAHPNLTIKPPSDDGKPRDILAAPSGKGALLSGELPRQLHGGAGVTATVGEDGSIRFHDPKGMVVDKSPFQAMGEGAGVGLSARFDVTDHVMRLVGQDPYGSVKRKMAEETREQRLCMAERFRGERQKQELFQLSTKVRHIAGREDLSVAQRRDLIFEIWDECAEDADSPADYGAMARATITAIVREAFPEGSALGYRPGELLALNGRRMSKALFAPYSAEETRPSHRPDAGPPAPRSCP